MKKKTRLFPRFKDDTKPPTVVCQVTICGRIKGATVKAITDAAGPQVVVKGNGIHLLSRPAGNHSHAVKLGNKIVKEGIDSYDGWTDMNKSIAESLFAIFGGLNRGMS